METSDSIFSSELIARQRHTTRGATAAILLRCSCMKRPFLVHEYVRWSDVDYAGIIFYGAYVRFFEIAGLR